MCRTLLALLRFVWRVHETHRYSFVVLYNKSIIIVTTLCSINSSADNSRRSSRAASLESRRRRSSTVSALLRQAAASSGGAPSSHCRRDHRLSVDVTSGKSSGSSHRARLPSTFAKLPGIEISRIDTMDFDDGSSMFSSTTGGLRLGGLVAGPGGRQRFIVIHSDGSSDISRLSFPSEYSLSATSRSRSSRASSNVSSRLWDFTSPRESEWDVADMAATSSSVATARGVGSSSAAATSRPDLRSGRDYSLLTPSMPRKGSSVTFDIGEPTVRRHSSPAPSLRFRKDSIIDVDGGGGSPCTACSAATAAGSAGKKSASKSSVVSQQLHQPLEKRSSSRSRCGDSQQDSLVSVVMTTSGGQDDSAVGSRSSKAGAASDSSSKIRSSVSSLKPSSMTGEKPAAATAKVEVVYGSGGVARSSLYTPLKRNTTSEPYHHLHQRDGSSREVSDGKDRPSSAPIKAEVKTQTPPSCMRSEAMQEFRRTVDSSGSNILSPPSAILSCGDKSLFEEQSASENEDNDSEDHDINVVDELLAANLDRRCSSAENATNRHSLSGIKASPECARTKMGGMTCKLSTSLFGRGRHQQQTTGATNEAKSSISDSGDKSATGQTSRAGSGGKSARSSIFVLLGLAE